MVTGIYRLYVQKNGRLTLYTEKVENGIKWDERTAEFSDWDEFLSVCIGSFWHNPFDTCQHMHVYGV